MNYTLLESIQMILSAMDSDEVSSHDDTIESTQVALLLKQVFYDIASDIGLPQQESLIELTASGDNAKPTLMTIPSGVARISSIRYDNRASADTYRDWREVCYLPFDEFVEMQNSLRDWEANVGQMTVTQNTESHEIMFRTDKHPSYYTTTNDSQIIFDSHYSDDDTTLQKAKTMCLAWVYPSWTMSNSFVPPLEPQQFSYFINKAKVRAFNELKQTDNREAIAEARRQKLVLQRTKKITTNGPAVLMAPRYGRK
jgi:hypothetical protein